MKLIIKTILLSLSMFGFAQNAKSENCSTVQRQWKLGISNSRFLHTDLEELSLWGPTLRYEFVIDPILTLGIHTSLRLSPNQNLSQLTYGLLIQHQLKNSFYMSYGLLLQVIRLKQHKGRGTAHDTRLTLGKEFNLFESLHFTEVSYHYSRLQTIDSSPKNLDQLELVYGVKL